MEFIEHAMTWMTEHTVLIVTIGGAIYEVVGRIWPTAKRASLFSWLGKLFVLIAKFSWVISDILSKILPDNRTTPKSELPK